MSSLLAHPSHGSRVAALTLAPSGMSLACSFPLGDGDSLSVCAVVNFFFPKFFLFTFPFSIGMLGRSFRNGNSPYHTSKPSACANLAAAVRTLRAAVRSWSILVAAGRLRNVHSSGVHSLRRGANFAIASCLLSQFHSVFRLSGFGVRPPTYVRMPAGRRLFQSTLY